MLIDEEIRKKDELRKTKKDLSITEAAGARVDIENEGWAQRLDGLKRGESYESLLGLDVRGINVLMNEQLKSRIFEPDSINSVPFIQEVPGVKDQSKIPEGKTVAFFKRFLGYLSRNSSKDEEKLYSLDILSFFAEVKGLAKNSQEAEKYMDRAAGYIKAIKSADLAGQNALKERLLGGLIINKYESVLNAIGKYYVIKEEDVVNFAKNTPKGLALDYIKNYIRPIPTEVINEITKMNELEIFDNYVILHYDPDRKSFKETFRELERRRDPILFGVIKGSKKLYYITDWIDEYCDLTLDKFVEVLQREKDTFKIPETIK